MNKAWEHFKLVMTHKKYVFQFACKSGIFWRGLTHDLSKFSPAEFVESARYFTGERSPIEISKQINGVSYAWQHHKGRNTHHWQYWLDNGPNGIVARIMPYEDCVAMICDQFAAGKAYMKNEWSLEYQYNWWEKRKKVHQRCMHPVVFAFADRVYSESAEFFEDEDMFFEEIFNRSFLKGIYSYYYYNNID